MLRCVAVRRVLTLHPEVADTLTQLWDHYDSRRHPGCNGGLCSQGGWDDSDSEGEGELCLRMNEQSMRGPVGLLLMAAAANGLTIDREWRVHDPGGHSFSIPHMPYQKLRPAALEVACAARDTLYHAE
eukprot:10308157-Alexandrium_andersonii.AAC.1